MEKDDAVKGNGNHYDLGLRNYDPRLGRMFSMDPRASEYPWQTPYAYHRNSPQSIIDHLGGGDNDDWYLDKNGEAVYDENVHSQTDLIDRGIRGTYLGEKGIGVPAGGNAVSYLREDGRVMPLNYNLQEVTVTGSDTRDEVDKYYDAQARKDEYIRKHGRSHAYYKAGPVMMGFFYGTLGATALVTLPAVVGAAPEVAAVLGTSYVASRSVLITIDASLQYAVTGDVDLVSLGTNLVPGSGLTLLYRRAGFALFDGAVDYKVHGGLSYYGKGKSLSDVGIDAAFSFSSMYVMDGTKAISKFGLQMKYGVNLPKSQIGVQTINMIPAAYWKSGVYNTKNNGGVFNFDQKNPYFKF